MSDFNEFSPAKKVGFVVLILAATFGIWRTASSLIPWGPSSRAMTADEFKENFRKSEELDRENWEKMWADAGKKAPLLPREMKHSPEHAEEQTGP